MPSDDPDPLHAVLADFERHATRVDPGASDPADADAQAGELYRFRVGDFDYDLHYWPQLSGDAVAKYVGGSPAARMFVALQSLQKAGIPARRVVAHLRGFRIGDRKGDACVVVHDPRVRPLDGEVRRGGDDRRRDLIAKVAQRLVELQRAQLCPIPLDLDCFGLREGRATPAGEGEVIVDAPLRRGGSHVTRERLNELGRSALRATSAAERLRVWRHFKPRAAGEATDPTPTLRTLFAGARDLGPPFARAIEVDGWDGVYMARPPVALPWASLSQVRMAADDWRRLLPALLGDVGSGEVLKTDRSGSVIARTVSLAGQEDVELVVKRPGFNKRFVKLWLQRVRRSRSLAIWKRTTRLLVRGFDVEYPLLALERRRFGVLLDQLVVFQRTPGTVLSSFDLGSLGAARRSRLMWRLGSTLRRIESLGWSHFDTKTTNWIVRTDEQGEPRPTMIDVYGLRFYPYRGFAVGRLLRALKQHPQFEPGDEVTVRAAYER